MYIYLLSSTVYMLCFCCLFLFFTAMDWSCKTKQKKEKCDIELVPAPWSFKSLSPLRLTEVSYCVDSLKYCSTCGSH